MPELRTAALHCLSIAAPAEKCAALRVIPLDCRVDPSSTLSCVAPLPGREERPQLVMPRDVPQRSLATPEGRAALIHALAHIELNAVNLALDIVWRFAGMPEDFYRDWFRVALEEADHFDLLQRHLQGMGFSYGDFPAHDGLWQMAEKTADDVLARITLVPRVLEARGLDVSPPIRAKLLGAGDKAGAAILDVILRDEIGHVALGNRWYHWLCAQRGLNPGTADRELAERYDAPRQRGPFNRQARLAAGFSETELATLTQESRT